MGTSNLSLENVYKEIEMKDGNGNVFSFLPNEKVYGRMFLSIESKECGKPFSQQSQSISNVQRYYPPQPNGVGSILSNNTSSNKRPIKDTINYKGSSHKKFNIEKIADTLSHSKSHSKNSFSNNYQLIKKEPADDTKSKSHSKNSSNYHQFIKKEPDDSNDFKELNDTKEILILDRNHFGSPTNGSHITVVPIENPSQINNYSIKFPNTPIQNAGGSSRDENSADMMPSVTYHSLDNTQKKAILRGALENLPLTCHVCGEGFERTCHFETHMKTMHTHIKAFNCKDCEVGFARKGDFQKHIVSVHKAVDNKIYECQVCGKRFWKRCYRDRHKASLHPSAK